MDPRFRGDDMSFAKSSLISGMLGNVADASPGDFVIHGKVVGRWRSPHVKRILRWIIAGLPFDIRRDEIDVVGEFGEAPPRVLYVGEIVRPYNVPADAPSPGVAAGSHVLPADADVIDACDMPARMVAPRAVRFHERQHMMIAAVRSVHESDELAGLIR